MKKIVIFSQQGQISHEFIVLLTALFPECDIRIAVPDGPDFETRTAGIFSKPDAADEAGT